MSLGPFDLNGTQFLELYAMLFSACIAFSLIIPAFMRPKGHERRVDDVDQLALLSGGITRLAETVIVRMMRTGAARISHRTIIGPGSLSAATRPIDAAIYRVLPGIWSVVEKQAKLHREPIINRLVRDGLMIDDETKWRMRWFQALPLITLVLFGITKLMIGMERGKPVMYLTWFLIATAILAIIRWTSIDVRTEGGKSAIADMRRTEDRLHRAPTDPETERAVALFGTAVLATTLYSPLHTLRKDSGSDGGSGGSDSDGAGGGGCGGCGGD